MGTALTRLERSADGWVANAAIHARVVVGAGGHFCPVARLLGAKTGGEHAIVAQETEFEMDARQLAGCRVRGEMPELYFCADLRGYGWCFRKGNFLNVGLGRADPHGLASHVSAFLRFLKAGRIDFDLPPLHGHAYLLRGTSSRRTIDDGVLLIGDAVGLAYPQSGEGIRPAIESGLLAAQGILAARGTYGRKQLESCAALNTSPRQTWLQKANHWIPTAALQFFARNLLSTAWFVRKVVLEKWFLQRY
jgi:flavin-dependent dehydrogenase